MGGYLISKYGERMKNNIMKTIQIDKLEDEGIETLLSKERRQFLKFGLAVTGVFLGGSILSLTSTPKAHGFVTSGQVAVNKFPYRPHYTMVIRQGRCIDCELCLEACRRTNSVPAYGYRTIILERSIPKDQGQRERTFMPILCNQCNRPHCVRVCPTGATFKDNTNGIVQMSPEKCIGCKTCMAACPYNARYYKEEDRAIDKCNFCFNTKLKESGGKTTACSAACPADVRIFGDLTNPDSEAYKLIHTPGNVFWVLRPETETLPNIFYMDA
jgi:Fe-S-cluster-containing dehydrogenase component